MPATPEQMRADQNRNMRMGSFQRWMARFGTPEDREAQMRLEIEDVDLYHEDGTVETKKQVVVIIDHATYDPESGDKLARRNEVKLTYEEWLKLAEHTDVLVEGYKKMKKIIRKDLKIDVMLNKCQQLMEEEAKKREEEGELSSDSEQDEVIEEVIEETTEVTVEETEEVVEDVVEDGADE